eukprot:360328-Chlamydomonas_euryale.AAC.7
MTLPATPDGNSWLAWRRGTCVCYITCGSASASRVDQKSSSRSYPNARTTSMYKGWIVRQALPLPFNVLVQCAQREHAIFCTARLRTSLHFLGCLDLPAGGSHSMMCSLTTSLYAYKERCPCFCVVRLTASHDPPWGTHMHLLTILGPPFRRTSAGCIPSASGDVLLWPLRLGAWPIQCLGVTVEKSINR